MLYRKSQKGFKGQKQKKLVHPLEGKEFTGKVRDVNPSGLAAIEHESGLIVLVRGAWLGEIVKVKITECKKRFAFAELISVLESNPDRVNPKCAHFVSSPSCGGCMWQFIAYSSQIAMKQKWVARAFAQVCRTNVSEILPSSDIWHYRNRVEFKTDGKKLGFLASQTNTLVDISECSVMNKKVSTHHQELRNQLPNSQWVPKGKSSSNTAPLTLIAVDDDLNLQNLVLNSRRPFKQANFVQNIELKQWLKGTLKSAEAKSPVLELFCGSGNFTKVLAESVYDPIIAIEASEIAIKELEFINLTGVEAICADLFNHDTLSVLCSKYSNTKTLVLDPPREGLLCIEPILALPNVEVIAYISCDLSSCVRDVKRFVQQGYIVTAIQPVDMFPHTPHVEVCVLLMRDACET